MPIMPPAAEGGADNKPIVARGIAIKKEEYMAMGPTSGCYGCKAIARGDRTHKPHNATCRERAIKWLKEQDDHRVQERRTSARVRQETRRQEEDEGEEEPRRKASRREGEEEELTDKWEIRGTPLSTIIELLE